jgi:arylsulfatase A-like enzyme
MKRCAPGPLIPLLLAPLMAACTPDEPPLPVGTPPPVATGPTATIHPGEPGAPFVGLRDLQLTASFSIAETFWTVDGDPADTEGPLAPSLASVPARALHPGQVWAAEVTGQNGESATATFTVPEPLGGNVLVLLLDDVGVDKIGAYGWETAAPTPNMDSLAAEGVRFNRAYASPVCSPTRGTVMTGRHPRRTGLGWIADTGSRDIILPYESTTIPEMLWEARGPSWSDAALGKWHMAGPQAPNWLDHPNASGFAWFAGPPGNPQYSPDRGYYAWSKNVNGVLEESTVYMTTAQVDDALEQIDVLPEPWFLYVAFNAAHGPLNLPPADLVSGPLPPADAPAEEKYDAVLEALDTEIGRLLDEMPDAVRERTTILLVGDNGTSDLGVPDDVDLYRNKHTPYEGGIRVPFIATGPHVAEPGRTSESLLHVADILPTVADLAGVPLSGPRGGVLETEVPVELDGRSIVPLLRDPAAAGRTQVYAEAVGNGPPPWNIDRSALQTATHKVVRWNGGDEWYVLAGPNQWDDVELDPEEATPEQVELFEALAADLTAAHLSYAYEGF